jgi:hypothetical protein
MITWWSEKLEASKAGKSLDSKSSKFDRHKDDIDEEWGKMILLVAMILVYNGWQGNKKGKRKEKPDSGY